MGSRFSAIVMGMYANRVQPVQERYIEGYTKYGDFECYINNVSYTATRNDDTGYFRLDLPLDLKIQNLANFCNGENVNNGITYLNLEHIGNTFSNTSLLYAFNNQVELTGIKFPSNFNTKNCVSVKRCFNGCKSLTSLNISMFDFTSVGAESSGDNSMSTFCYNCSSIEKLYLPTLPTNPYYGSSTWYGMTSLTTITCNGTINCNSGKLSVSFLQSTALTRQSALNLINALADRTNESSAKLILASNVTENLTDDDILIATNKNWQIKNS